MRSEPDDDRVRIKQTALGPADVRDTPHVKSQFAENEAPDDEEVDPWIGRLLSNVYEITEKIGEGGMGSVYLAHHVHLKKTFAIKVLADSIAGKDNAVERLKQEAISAAGIDHENIVDVVNFDRTEEGAVFIVMEHLKGESLADTIGRGPIQMHRALPITYQICRALHAAHEHGIVHRDLKPENVFLSQKGDRTIVKVLDFGISKIKKADAEQVRMTKTGQLVGTPLYMSPEQARGESEIDRRVDVYAMGVMLYEMITGTPPFDGRNYFELLWKHGNEPAPGMGELNPNIYVPGAIELAVSRALTKERDARFQTMAELEHALMQAAPDVPSLPALLSLPAEGSEPGLVDRPSFFGRAPTEAMDGAPNARAVNTDTVTLPKRNLGPPIVAGLGALFLVGAIGYALTQGEAPPETTEPEPVADVEPVEPTAVQPDQPDEPVEPVEDPATPEGIDPPTTTVNLTSNPPGATVRIGGEVVGTTPFELTREISSDEVQLRFERAGYMARNVPFRFAEGAELSEVRLRRRPPREENGTAPLPIKTGL